MEVYSRYVDYRSAFPEWNQNSSGILVVPVGSLEQHSYPLPIGTDTFLAEHFARKAAAEFSAAMLPPVSICTSYEHRGFRGSFSFRPETVAGIIRDITDDAERQHFNRIIIVNYHGGNFILGPVIREINSLNRPVKIILAAPYTFCRRKTGELHAGEIESSLMAHLFPDVIGEKRYDANCAAWRGNKITPEDLNTFGIGRIAEKGAVGYPEKTSSQLGRELEQEITAGLLPWLRDRLGMLQEQPFYQGSGGITLRRLTPADISRCMELKDAAGWNQTNKDWKVLLGSARRVAHAAVYNGNVRGTVTAVEYADDAAWIGMVLVDPEYRKRGIATRLLRYAADLLKDFSAIGLDATPQGSPLYEKMGFVPCGRIFRMEVSLKSEVIPDTPDLQRSGTVLKPMRPQDIERLEPVDRLGFGFNRTILLRNWYDLTPGKNLIALDKSGEISGFCFIRPGTAAWQIGPLNAQDEETALLLLSSILKTIPSERVFLDVPEGRNRWEDSLRETGFRRSREFTRMVLGDPEQIGPGNREWIIAGPEVG